MKVAVYVTPTNSKPDVDGPVIAGIWDSEVEACDHALKILRSGAFTEVILVASPDASGKSSPQPS